MWVAAPRRSAFTSTAAGCASYYILPVPSSCSSSYSSFTILHSLSTSLAQPFCPHDLGQSIHSFHLHRIFASFRPRNQDRGGSTTLPRFGHARSSARLLPRHLPKARSKIYSSHRRSLCNRPSLPLADPPAWNPPARTSPSPPALFSVVTSVQVATFCAHARHRGRSRFL